MKIIKRLPLLVRPASRFPIEGAWVISALSIGFDFQTANIRRDRLKIGFLGHCNFRGFSSL